VVSSFLSQAVHLGPMTTGTKEEIEGVMATSPIKGTPMDQKEVTISPLGGLCATNRVFGTWIHDAPFLGLYALCLTT
jgi:hypothetical protein